MLDFTLPTHYGAILDGSAALDHTARDVRAWHEASETYPQIGADIHRHGDKLATVEPLMRDLFWAMYKRAERPRVDPPVPLGRAYQPHVPILTDVVEMPEFAALRKHGTVGDSYLSSVAASGIAADILAAIPEPVQRQAQACADAERALRLLEAQADALEALAEEAAGAGDAAQCQALAAKATAKRRAAATTQAGLPAAPTLTDGEQDGIRQAARGAVAAAMQAADDANEAAALFGGIGTEEGDPLGESGDATLKAQLAQHLLKDPAIRAIIRKCGRLTRIAMTQVKQRLSVSPDEVVGMEEGNDLARVLPSDLVLMSDADTETHFWYRWSIGALQQYKISSNKKPVEGDAVFVVDESGSMGIETAQGGSRMTWAKAVGLAYIQVCRMRKRNIRCISFSGPRDALKVWDFHFAPGSDPALAATPDRLLAFAQSFIGGGTDYNGWMESALEVVTKSMPKADVVLVSDGLADVTPEREAAWQTLRAERDLHTYSILIGAEERGSSLLARISDEVHDLGSLADDAPMHHVFGL